MKLKQAIEEQLHDVIGQLLTREKKHNMNTIEEITFIRTVLEEVEVEPETEFVIKFNEMRDELQTKVKQFQSIAREVKIATTDLKYLLVNEREELLDEDNMLQVTPNIILDHIDELRSELNYFEDKVEKYTGGMKQRTVKGVADVSIEYTGYEEGDYEYIVEVGVPFTGKYKDRAGVGIEDLEITVDKKQIDSLPDGTPTSFSWDR